MGALTLAALLSRGVDADAASWATRVTSAGGTYSAATLHKVNAFVRDCKNAAVWAQHNRINLVCGNQLTAALVPLKVGAGNATDTNGGSLFQVGDYTEATGLTGNGTTKYLNTGLTPAAAGMTLTNGSMFCYSTGAVEGTTKAVMGSSGGSGNDTTAIYQVTGPNARGTIAGANSVNASSVSGLVTGFTGVTVNGSRVLNLYKNGVSVSTSQTASGALTAQPIYIFSLNVNGVTSSYAARGVQAYSIGTALTAAEALAYNTIMERFQDALGRGVQ
jgi:hypothetical protein